MFLDPVLPTDVINVIRKLKPKSSSGSDEISTKLLIKIVEHIVIPITHIVNISMETGIFPNELKYAKVIPIHKSGDPRILNNYRPISRLSSFSKLFERIMYNKIMKFLTSNDILYKHQYGFRPKHCTIHPIIHLLIIGQKPIILCLLITHYLYFVTLARPLAQLTTQFYCINLIYMGYEGWQTSGWKVIFKTDNNL